MEIKTNKIDGANAEIEAVIPKATVDANVEKVAKELSKTANVQGFRKLSKSLISQKSVIKKFKNV